MKTFVEIAKNGGIWAQPRLDQDQSFHFFQKFEDPTDFLFESQGPGLQSSPK